MTYVGEGADNKNSDSASVALYLARGDLERLISLFNFFEPLFNFDLNYSSKQIRFRVPDYC